MFKKSLLVFTLLCTIVIAGSAFAASTGPVSIQGTVSDALTNVPIANCYMMLAKVNKDGSWSHLAQIYTDGSGHYEFTDIPGLVSGSKYNVLATYQVQLGVYQGDNITKLYPKPGAYTLDFQLIPLQ